METLTPNVEERRVGIITLIYGNGNNGLDLIVATSANDNARYPFDKPPISDCG